MPGDPRSAQRLEPPRPRAVDGGAEARADPPILGQRGSSAMTTDSGPPTDQDDLTDAELRRIDQICDGFENAWKSARRPQIEGFLDGATGASRRALLRELVHL